MRNKIPPFLFIVFVSCVLSAVLRLQQPVTASVFEKSDIDEKVWIEEIKQAEKRACILEVRAAKGDMQCACALGLAFLRGDRVARNEECGLKWLKFAAKSEPTARFHLAARRLYRNETAGSAEIAALATQGLPVAIAALVHRP